MRGAGQGFLPLSSASYRRATAAAWPRPHCKRGAEDSRKREYLGAIWTQGSPRIEEAIYWFNLILDVSAPLCGNAAQRYHGTISNDGPKNIVDSVEYITSRVWADDAGRDRVGTVLIQEQQIFAARDVQKGDARPGGYVTTGGHGGIIGGAGHDGPSTLTYFPATRHTFTSEVNIARLPETTSGVRIENGRIVSVRVPIKDRDGFLLESAIPKVTIVKDGSFLQDDYQVEPKGEVDLQAMIADNLARAPLAGFVIEGFSPYGKMSSEVRHRIMSRAAFLGFPIARVGRGNNEGFTPSVPQFIGGRNLTATKARILLTACLMKFGALPVAANPDRPTADERRALQDKLALYQAVFDTH
jgi:L-asparaginase